jgi:hypothetical protein
MIVHATFYLENVKNRYHFEDLGVNRRIILKWFVVQPWGIVG